MSERGVFAVDRGIWTDPDFAKEPFTEREAFLWLVSEAAWKLHRKRADGKVIDLERGQLCHSVRFMAEAWQWSKSRVDRFLGRLENRDMIKRPSGTRTPVITICNYDAFQRVALPERDNNGTTTGTRVGQERDKLESIENIESNNSTSLRSVEPAPKRKARKPETEIDPDWQPDEQDVAYALKKGMTMGQLPDERDRYVNHHLRKGSLFRDWHAAWRTWVDSPYRKSAQAPPPRAERREPVSKNPFVADLLNHMDPRHDTPDDDLSAAPHARSHGTRLVEYGCQVQEPSRSATRPVPPVLDLQVSGSFGRRAAGS